MAMLRTRRDSVGSIAAGKWLKRETNFKSRGHTVYDYHVSGHYMDGFKDGVTWQKRQAKLKKRKKS